MLLKLQNRIIRDNIFYRCQNYDASWQIDLLRVASAMFGVITFLQLLIDFDIFFSPDCLINWEVTNASSLWFELHPAKISALLRLDFQTVLLGSIIFYFITLFNLLLGILPRFNAFLSLLLFIMFGNLTSPYGYGVDVYLTLSLFFLSLFPSGYHLTLIKRTFSSEVKQVQCICLRTFQIYLALTYLNAGFEKALMEDWWNGKFIFYLINDPTLMVNPIVPTNLPIWLYSLIGLLVVFLETFYIVFVWVPYFRTALMIGIILMHGFIAFSMGLVAFGALLLILNTIAWYPTILADIKTLYNGKKI